MAYPKESFTEQQVIDVLDCYHKRMNSKETRKRCRLGIRAFWQVLDVLRVQGVFPHPRWPSFEYDDALAAKRDIRATQPKPKPIVKPTNFDIWGDEPTNIKQVFNQICHPQLRKDKGAAS